MLHWATASLKVLPGNSDFLTMQKKKLFISDGMRVGILTVGELVYNVQEHPLFYLTKQSYLQHGRLRECRCDCGQTVLYSENALQSGTLKSCGCLREKRRSEAFQNRISNEKKRIHRMEITQRIRAAQLRLKTLQSAPEHLRNTPENNMAISQLATELRKLFAMKGRVNRKA